MAKDRLIWKMVLDFVILCCVGSPLLVILIWGKPYERGYFENDPSIRLPFKEHTLPEAVLAGLGFAINVITIILTEAKRHKSSRGLGDKFLCGSLVPAWLWESYNAIGIFAFGAACQQLTCEIAKLTIGRLRPHFYDICRPIPDENSPLNSLGYIQAYRCTNTDEFQLKDMRLSFPSAHASFAMYAAVFFSFYVQTNGKWRGSKLLRHFIQFAVLMGAWYSGLSRIVDHMHHFSDVVIGFAIGATYAVLVFIFVLKPKQYHPGSSTWQESAPQENILPRPVLAR